MRAITAIATPAAPQAMVRLDTYASSPCAVAALPSGGASYTIDTSFDDPNDLVNPIALGSMIWDASMSKAVAATTAASFVMPASPTWARLRLINATGSVKATFLQVGQHSHSNITSGPFAPHMAVQEDDGMMGDNFRAMGK